MPKVTIVRRPCPRHQFCGRDISERSEAKYCGKCQQQLLTWMEKNPWADALSDQDIFFIFEHPNGCGKAEAALYLDISEENLSSLQRETGPSDQLNFQQMVRSVRVVRKIGKLAGSFIEEALVFIKDHLMGCFAKELRSYLAIPETTFNVYLRTGDIKLEKKWRVGKEVFKWIGFAEMVRIIDLGKNWVSLYQIAEARGKRYTTLVHYADDGYFGELGRNLEGRLSLHHSVLLDFDERWQRAAAHHKANRWQSKRRMLGSDEIQLGMIKELLGISCWGNLWIYVDKGWLPGESRNGMFVIKIPDLKEFLLKVAGGEYPVQRRLLGDWKSSPLGGDFVFVEEMEALLKEDIPPEKQPIGNGSTLVGPGELTIKQVADIFSARRGTVALWFTRKLIDNAKIDGVYRTTFDGVREFIRDVLQGKCRVSRSCALAALEHPLISQNQAFVKEMKQLL